MQNSSQVAPSPSSQSFAGLLAALASPAKNVSDGTQAWSDPGLEDDVVTLSYERALRAHARSKPANRGDGASEQAAGTCLGDGLGDAWEAPPAAAAKVGLTAAAGAGATAHPAAELERRTASVTIRMSNAECAQLRQRAAEVGLTVSAYLRSCVLEADTLRAQVKQALAEMRTANGTGTKETGTKETRGQGNKGTRPIRVLAHIGSLCIGLSATKPS